MPSGILQQETAAQNTHTYARPVERNSYPDAVALREALQNPAKNLCEDLDLNQATVALDRNGFPLTYTGRFAVVFRLVLPGEMTVALRLFTTPEKEFIGERAERLKRATEILRARQSTLSPLLPAPVYLPQVVRVAGEWYPAQILPWAEGESLLDFADRHRENPTVLRSLADTIACSVARLEEAGVAHGDLQHDNILVAEEGRRITLVDYDALYASELRDLAPPAERGHRHYQHPGRTIAHYGVGTDRFACAVLCTGLLLLATDATLWDRFGGTAGESLLFTEADFRAPYSSPLFTIARESSQQDIKLRNAFQELEAQLQLPEPVLIYETKKGGTAEQISIPRRLPARVTPNCDEEQVKPVSYLAPLRRPAMRRADRANATALRGYVLLVPPVVSFFWTAAWNDGGAKWTFLAYLFVICMALLFSFLYMTWGVKQQLDMLITEMGRERLVRDQAKERVRLLEARLCHLPTHPVEIYQERRYQMQVLAQIPLSRAIGDFGASSMAVRELRDRGIQTAAHLARRYGFLPSTISGKDAALLRDWLEYEKAIAYKQFVRETQPEQMMRDELAVLASRIVRCNDRLAALREEQERFPDASLKAFVRRVLPPIAAKEGNHLLCGE